MSRKPSVWYWKDRGVYCTTIDGQRHLLGEDKKQAEKEFYKLMSGRGRVTGQAKYLTDVFQPFHEWNKENRAKRTADRYFDFLDAFQRRWPSVRLTDLNPSHVTIWLTEQKGWNSTTKRNAITALQRAFNWGVKNMGLEKNPIKGIEKPEAKTRTTIIPQQDFDAMVVAATGPFRDLLILTFDTGARPQEIKRLEARHVDLEKQRALIPIEDDPKGGVARAIYFPTDRSLATIRRCMKEHPEGPILRNRLGNPWTGFAVKNAFEKLEEKTGKRYHHYALRHSFITRKLVAGVDSHVVATLAGHRDTSMIDRTYSHIADDYNFLLEQAKRDVTEPSAAKKKKKPSVASRKRGKTPKKKAGRPRRS